MIYYEQFEGKMHKIQYKELLENISDWLWEVNSIGVYTHCSENVYDFLGFRAQEVIGKTPFDFMTDEEGQRVSRNFADYTTNKKHIINLENTYLHKNGYEIVVETSAIPILDNNDNLLGYQGLDRDITKRKSLERAIQKQNNALETLFEKSSDGVSILQNNRFIKHNEQIVSILGYKSKEELLHVHPSKLSPEFQPDGQSSFEKAEKMMRLALKNKGHSFEWMHVRANGENFWAEIVLTPISLVDSDIIYVVWRDISKSKAMTIKLQNYTDDLNKQIKNEVEKNRKKDQQILHQSRLAQMGEMISMIAHQWRQPLSAISSTTINLQLKLLLDTFDVSTKEAQEESKEYLKKQLAKIEDYVQNLTVTIDDFRNFYKPNKESVVTTFENIVKKALNIIKSSLDNRNIKLTIEYKSKNELKLYENEMVHVILNILKNAQDNFIEKKTINPEIKITLTQNNIIICDNGGGIQENIIENIFDPYFSTKDEKNGTGLGLYMSKIIVEEHHNGMLHVNNTRDENNTVVGVCFTVTI